jgi:hypothetical protein
MPSHGLTLGQSIIETSTFREDTDPAVVRALMNLNSVLIGAGFPAPAETGDTSYQLVYTREVTGADVLYGGKPSDPMNPDVLVISSSGSATVIWQEEGADDISYGTVSFVGPTVTVTDGGTKAIVTIVAAATAFTTIVVSGSSDVVADSAADTLTLVAGNGMAITTDAGTDTITYAFDPTDFAGYNVVGDFYLKLINGVLTWVAPGAC